MKFKRLASFIKDFDGLNREDQIIVNKSFKDVSKALSGDVELYKKFKVKKMKKYKEDGIYEGHLEINLVFTLHFEYDEIEKICYFRRIGDHSIYKNP